MKAFTRGVSLYAALCLGLIIEQPEAAADRQNRRTTSFEALLTGQTARAGDAKKNQQFSQLVESVHRQVNDFRRLQGLLPLTLNPIISAQAREHSAEMARNGNAISHRGFAQRLQDIREKLPYRAGAENVAASVGYENPAQTVVEGWKNSPAHRKNILGNYSLTGIGIAQSDQGGYFFTQIFLEPLR